MFAWMNRDTLEMTLASGEVTYWSRSRQTVWRKGESSGHTQRLVEAYVDCDGDVVLLKVDQIGPGLPYRGAKLLLPQAGIANSVRPRHGGFGGGIRP